MSFTSADGKESKQPSTSSSIPWSQTCRHIEYSEILNATKKFDKSLVIGSGGFGKVYKGYISNGTSLVVAAIKRLDPKSSQGPNEFWAEVKMLSMLHHHNIVSLIGYCIYDQEKILVYEYMSNGTLDDHLHKRGTSLSWLRRLKICLDAGLGLRYLHNEVGVDSGIIHRDFKSSNILLHDNWTARISDFGLSKTCPTNRRTTHISTNVKGSFGYFDPNYFRTGQLTRKSDVYAFGVVLLEVLCRKPAVDKLVDDEWRNLATWAQDSIKNRNLKRIIDVHIRGEISPKCLKEFVRIAERCLHDNPEQRPTMAGVVVTLESIVASQEKYNMQATSSRTIFDRMADMLPFTSNVQGDSKLSGMSNRFTYEKLIYVTKHFQKTLGKGASGAVFEGALPDGSKIAVKLVKGLDLFKNVFLTEVQCMGSIHHVNVVRLQGFCALKSQSVLVYEYMSNGSLNRWIYHGVRKHALNWECRKKIILDVAKGLAYLHEECRQKIIHLDVKPHNILLDSNFNAKLTDFGCSKLINKDQSQVITMMRETRGYLAPEWWLGSFITEKADVYSFGIVILEILSGKKNFDTSQPEESRHLLGVLQNCWEHGTLQDMVDKYSEDMQTHSSEVVEMIKLASWCLQRNFKKRPSMSTVVKVLEGVMTVESRLDYNFIDPRMQNTAVEHDKDMRPLLGSVLPGPSLYAPEQLVTGMTNRFTYKELKSATGNFTKVLRLGVFGAVFEGTLEDGSKIAVKRLEGPEDIYKSFLAEVESIGSIHHVNVVRLEGFCALKSQPFLVYEYMSNGSLDRWIYHGVREHALNWECRKKIILDVAKGLAYLHEECRQKIIHLDVKPHNILLDSNFNAKLTDFGCSILIDKDQSQVITLMRGTRGYEAPECWLFIGITEKADVYSFGIVILEILSGKKNFDTSQPEESRHLLGVLQNCLEHGTLQDMVDKYSEDMQSHSSEVVEMIKLASWCSQSKIKKRPSMSTVVKVLEGVIEVEYRLDYNFTEFLNA